MYIDEQESKLAVQVWESYVKFIVIVVQRAEAAKHRAFF